MGRACIKHALLRLEVLHDVKELVVNMRLMLKLLLDLLVQRQGQWIITSQAMQRGGGVQERVRNAKYDLSLRIPARAHRAA